MRICIDEKLKQKIRNDFDCLAMYDREVWNHNNHYHHFLLKQLPNSCKTVLDIGCGTGEFSRLLAKRSEQVIAIDLSAKMIEVAKQRSREFLNIDFQVADVLQWQFPVGRFDAIASISALHHLPVATLLPELKTALRPEGKLVILDLLAPENLRDRFSDLVAVPLNWVFKIIKNQQIQPSPEVVAAMKAHALTDKYLTLSQAQQIYTRSMKGAKVRKHLFWRYSVVWAKSETESSAPINRTSATVSSRTVSKLD